MKKMNTRLKVTAITAFVGLFALLLIFTVPAMLKNETPDFSQPDSTEPTLREKLIQTIYPMWPYYTFDTAIEEASVIVYGKVVGIKDGLVHDKGTLPDGTPHFEVYKEITVEVIEGVKGVDAETSSVTCIEVGGETEDLIYIVEGRDPVEMGKEYIFFLGNNGSPSVPLTLMPPRTVISVVDGMAQTRARIAPTEDTEYPVDQYITAIKDRLN